MSCCRRNWLCGRQRATHHRQRPLLQVQNPSARLPRSSHPRPAQRVACRTTCLTHPNRLKGIRMPLVRIDVVRERDTEQLRTLLEAIHDAVVAALDVPATDRYQIPPSTTPVTSWPSTPAGLPPNRRHRHLAAGNNASSPGRPLPPACTSPARALQHQAHKPDHSAARRAARRDTRWWVAWVSMASKVARGVPAITLQ